LEEALGMVAVLAEVGGGLWLLQGIYGRELWLETGPMWVEAIKKLTGRMGATRD